MKVHATTRSNGLRAVALARPDTTTVASRIFVKGDHRYDGEQNGIAHDLEHALFRSTPSRASRELYTQIEAPGGRIQGESIKDYLASSAVTGAGHCRAGLEGLVDMRSASSGEHYILRNPRSNTYLKIAPEDYFLWKPLDDEHSVRDLAVAYPAKYRVFPFDSLAHPIAQLTPKRRLDEHPVQIHACVFLRLRHSYASLAGVPDGHDDIPAVEPAPKGGTIWAEDFSTGFKVSWRHAKNPPGSACPTSLRCPTQWGTCSTG